MQGWGWQTVHHPDYVESVTEDWSSKIKKKNHMIIYSHLKVRMEILDGS